MTISIDAIILGAGAAALGIAWVIDVFVPRTVRTPERMTAANGRPVMIITLLAFFAWLVVPALLISPQERDDRSAGTRSTSAPTDAGRQFSSAQTVMLGLAGASAGIVTMLIGDATLRPRGSIRLGFNPARFPRGLTSGLIGAGILIPITLASTLLTDWIYQSLRFSHPDAHQLLQILRGADQPGLRGMIFVSALLIAPLFEELFFRGHVQTLFGALMDQRLGRSAAARWIAIVVTSALFALVHAPWMVPPIFVLSIGLGYAYERTSNLWTPIVMHATFNILNVWVFTHLNGAH